MSTVKRRKLLLKAFCTLSLASCLVGGYGVSVANAQDSLGGQPVQSAPAQAGQNIRQNVRDAINGLPQVEENPLREIANNQFASMEASKGIAFQYASPIISVINVITQAILYLLPAFLFFTMASDLLYAIAPSLRFLYDSDDVAQNVAVMSAAHSGQQQSQKASFKLFKVSDNMLQAMTLGGMMQDATSPAPSPMGGMGAMGGMGGMGGFNQPAPASKPQASASKHVLFEYLKKQAFTIFLMVACVTVLFSQTFFNFNLDLGTLIVRGIAWLGEFISGR